MCVHASYPTRVNDAWTPAYIYVPFFFYRSFSPPLLLSMRVRYSSFSLAFAGASPSHIKLAGFFLFFLLLPTCTAAMLRSRNIFFYVILKRERTWKKKKDFSLHERVVICNTKPCDYLSFFFWRLGEPQRRPAVPPHPSVWINTNLSVRWLTRKRF